MSGPQAALLADGRLHLHHGPIDLVIAADGTPAAVRTAFRAAAAGFPAILPTLCTDLPLLRRPLTGSVPPVAAGPVAARMIAACWPHRAVFITPMAAVAGAVAEAVLAAMLAAAARSEVTLSKAMVNNGGDIALHLGPGSTYKIGLVADLAAPALDGTITLDHRDEVRGIATSGWRGRSQSRGIADAVTVLAASAAEADAAATLIANAVSVDHPAIRRLPARQVKDDSDLGDLPVTVAVPPLPGDAIAAALDAGSGAAERMLRCGLIAGAVLWLQGRSRLVGALPAARLPSLRRDAA